MYNHYVRDKDGNYTKVSMEEPSFEYVHIPQPTPASNSPPKSPPNDNPAPPKSTPNPVCETPPSETPRPPKKDPPPQRTPEIQFANKILGHLSLGDIDSGDLLLLILFFFLFHQKADEELLIALGLLLIL